MNTATRVYERNQAERFFQVSGLNVGMLILLLGLLLSAFGVVYAKDLNRRLFIQYQDQQLAQQQYQVEWSKLLLEQGALSTQARIQFLAQNQLNMVTPQSRDIVLVENERAMLAEND